MIYYSVLIKYDSDHQSKHEMGSPLWPKVDSWIKWVEEKICIEDFSELSFRTSPATSVQITFLEIVNIDLSVQGTIYLLTSAYPLYPYIGLIPDMNS